MPTYRATGTKVELYSASLASTTTLKPERGKGSFTSNEAARAENILKKGKLLTETPIPCCGEDTRLHYLGLNKEVPFFMMHAGAELYYPASAPTGAERAQALLDRIREGKVEQLAMRQSPERSAVTDPSSQSQGSVEALGKNHSQPEDDRSHVSIRSELEPGAQSDVLETPEMSKKKYKKNKNSNETEPTFLDEHDFSSSKAALSPATIFSATSNHANQETTTPELNLIPQALGLVVTLTSKTFLRSFDNKEAKQDVKIDVFFNGDFVESTTVPSRWSGDRSKAGQGNMIQLISGKRIQRLVERPWVIVPSLQNPDGSLRSVKHTKVVRAGPHERWEQIGAALLKEAEAQGFNSYGDCTPLGSYLASLSKLEMPNTVQNLQKPGGLKFGVVDVIVSAGSGKKGGADTFYLTEPTRLVDERFKHVVGGFNRGEVGELSSSAITIPISSDAWQPAQPMAGVSRAAAALNSSVARRVGNVDMIVPWFVDEHTTSGREMELDNTILVNKEDSGSGLGRTEDIERPSKPNFSEMGTEKTNEEWDQHMTKAVAQCGESSAQHTHSFPSFPLADSLDSASIIDTFPFVDENQPHSQPDAALSDSFGIDYSSREEGRHDRGYAINHLYEFTGLVSSVSGEGTESSVPRGIMAPPQTPSPAFSAISKRRKSDSINSSGLDYPSKRRGSNVISKVFDASPQTTGSKTVSGFLGMTRRGVISRRTHGSPVSRELKPDSSESNPLASCSQENTENLLGEKVPIVTRIVIKAKEVVIVDRTLEKPFHLSARQDLEGHTSVHSSSPVCPLDEAVVFGLVDVSKGITPPLFPKLSAPGQTMTPQPSSSPTRLANQTPCVYNPNVRTRAGSSSFQSGSSALLPLARQSLAKSTKNSAAKMDPSPDRPVHITRASSSARNSASKPSSSRKPSKPAPLPKNPQSFLEELTEAWKTPKLSTDCVLSYADAAWDNVAEQAGVVRHIKSARPGWFQESEVVLAVRYVIG
jgi:hypothetical protein